MTAVHAGPHEVDILVERQDVLRTGFSARTKRPYTLYRLYATYSNGAAFERELRTFHHFDVGPARVTLEPVREDGSVEVRKVRDAAEEVRERRSKARAAVMGEPTTSAEAAERPSLARIDAIEQRLDALDARLDLILQIIQTKE